MELDWLETFLAVVDNGGFTAAAVQVHRSQSRVSAHIAALERDLGVRLIDRTHRPATLTPAGRLFAEHAREIIAELAAARATVGVLRSMDEESLAVLTTPSIGAALFPDVLAGMLDRFPDARVALSELGWVDADNGELGDGFVMAVLPTLGAARAGGLREQLLWREPIRVLVPVDHELALAGGAPVTLQALLKHPLVVTWGTTRAESEIPSLLAARGLDVVPRFSVDNAQTLVEMTRRGLGVGIEGAVALGCSDTTGLALLEIEGAELGRAVAVYWYDVLTSTEVGQALHQSVVDATLPRGAIAV